ncbi:probable glucan endo-1,3-beta-glucosidase BG4 [Quercus suber]|uniref:probable glucan endo-1,3-beta-glucosidase BG4 n=1 Tax=Quercus suber TaxID=58331 RepID=UPI0032DE4150
MLSTIKKLQADILYSGVVYGTSGNNIPDAAAAITVCHKHGIRRIRILDTDELAIQSPKSMRIEATVGVKDEDLPVLASSYEAVKSWFEVNLKPSVPFEFVVNYIVVGNKVIPGPNDGLICQDFATFSAHKAVYWDNGLGYWNMFDALVDAFVWAMEKRELIVKMVIGETGWPSTGNGQTTTPELARTYNQNFLRHITAGQGTPKRPNTYGEGFVYSMFDENGKLEAGDQRFGIFDAKEKPVYHLYFLYPKSASN